MTQEQFKRWKDMIPQEYLKKLGDDVESFLLNIEAEEDGEVDEYMRDLNKHGNTFQNYIMCAFLLSNVHNPDYWIEVSER